MQYQEKELLQGYEIKNWNFTPLFYKLLGAAAIFNILTIFVLGQADVFTTRGCDSPLVGNFCQVLDTVYMGSKLLETNSEFVSNDYQKTELEDAEITFVDVSSATPPLSYPEGYFALANPESAVMQMPNPNPNPNSGFPTTYPLPGFPGIPSNPTVTGSTDLLAKPQVTPTPNPKVGNIDPNDLSPFTIENTQINKNPIPPPPGIKNGQKPIRRSPFGKPSGINPPLKPPTNTDTTAETKPPANQPPLTSDAVADAKLNKKPFEDLGDFINDSLDKKEIDLNKPFLVVMDGVINEDGKLDPKKSKFIRVEGDEKMREVARQAIEAVGDSGFLTYLKTSGVDKVNFTIVQDDKQINVILISDQKTPEKAKSSVSLLNTILSGLKYADEQKLKTLDDNSKTLIENSKITSEGKNFTLNFMLPKQTAQDIITKTLKSRAEKKAEEQLNGKPSSTAQTVNTNQKTSK